MAMNRWIRKNTFIYSSDLEHPQYMMWLRKYTMHVKKYKHDARVHSVRSIDKFENFLGKVKARYEEKKAKEI